MQKKSYSVDECLTIKQLFSHEYISTLAENVSELLENEITPYRPAASDGNPGSLLEFKNDLPAIIVPDIHARPYFLQNILKYPLPADFLSPSSTVEEALKNKFINVICVGDSIHTELTVDRWYCIEEEFKKNIITGPFMKAEMKDCLSALAGLMNLKLLYPENFHFLKGNHENILNQNEGGDFAFRKYADEGYMVRRFISEYYGDDVLYLISCWEKALPLVAVGSNYVVSHAEPLKAYSREKLIDARSYPEVVNGLIWTRNGDVKTNTAREIMKKLLAPEKVAESYYFAGHRPVYENYALRQDGGFIQIHNPYRQNIALVSNDKTFNPESDIVGVDYE